MNITKDIVFIIICGLISIGLIYFSIIMSADLVNGELKKCGGFAKCSGSFVGSFIDDFNKGKDSK